MALTFSEKLRYRKLPLLRVLLASNLLFAVSILVAWQCALIFVLDPLNWSASGQFAPRNDLTNIFTYPLILFWAGPALAMMAGWILAEAKKFKMAFGVLVLPMLLIVVTIVMYGLVPNGG